MNLHKAVLSLTSFSFDCWVCITDSVMSRRNCSTPLLPEITSCLWTCLDSVTRLPWLCPDDNSEEISKAPINSGRTDVPETSDGALLDADSCRNAEPCTRPWTWLGLVEWRGSWPAIPGLWAEAAPRGKWSDS